MTPKWTPKWTRRVLAAWLFCALFGAYGASLLSQRSAAAPLLSIDKLPATLEVSLETDKEQNAGAARRAIVRVHSTRTLTGPLRLDIRSSLSTTRMSGSFSDGVASFIVPSTLIDSGHSVTFEASTQTERGSIDQSVKVGEAAAGVTPVIGPRHMVADGQHSTTVSVLPVDIQNNSLPDDTTVVLSIRRPDGVEETITGTVQGLVAGITVPSGTKAGFTSVRVAIGKATGPESQVLEVAGPPMPFELETDGVTSVANGRSLIEIRTPRLVDKYANPIEDGTQVEVRGVSPDGPFKVSASTIDGRAVVRLRAPLRPGIIEAVATAAGVASKPLRLIVGNDVADYDVATRRSGSSVSVTVGPITSGLGGFVPNGTPALITVSDGTTESVEVRDGFAKVVVDAEPGDRISVEVLGRVREVNAS